MSAQSDSDPMGARRDLELPYDASPAVLEEAEIEAALAAHDEWTAAGRPGAVSHGEAMAELLDEQP